MRLYLLELPGTISNIALVLSLLIFTDSLISSQVYEIVKTIYSTTASETSDSARVSVLQNTLGQLRLANIATLDAITTHFTRLIELTSADEAFISALAHNLAPCILRPRVESSLTMHERHSYRLIRDLFEHKEAIFGELKRASTLSHTSSGSGRPRAISTDESNRRTNMEARNRAIASRSRASSPQPAPGRGHRRDRSSGGPETRFPIQTNSPVVTNDRRPLRQSLEVPGANDASPVVDSSSANIPSTPSSTAHKPLPAQPTANGTSEHAIPATTANAATDDSKAHSPTVQKRDSLNRSTAGVGRFPRKPGQGSLARQSLTANSGGAAAGKRDSYGVGGGGGRGEGERPAGVTLSDKPMDD